MNKKVIAFGATAAAVLALAVPAFAFGYGGHHGRGNKNITKISADSSAYADTGNNYEDVLVNVSMAGNIGITDNSGNRNIDTGNATANSLAKVKDACGCPDPDEDSCGGECGSYGHSHHSATTVTKIDATSMAGAYTGGNTADVMVGVTKAHNIGITTNSGSRNIVTGNATATSNAWVLVN
ncbi:MAG: hypothetical protein ABH867_03250 [Patescibacteria group bacterium]|nr:hypothetical protein [Patescibacteria group bacterium]